MLDVVLQKNYIPAMTTECIDVVRQMEVLSLKEPQANVLTQHIIHAGVYTRTLVVPAGVMITGVLIKIPTTLILCGDVVVYTGSDRKRLQGYNTFAASANRKLGFVACDTTYITMSFATTAQTVDAAEKQFTDEYALLVSHLDSNTNEIIITGE